MSGIYFCCNEGRRAAVVGSDLNGIDFLEVSEDQVELRIHLINELKSNDPDNEINIIIKGGERIRNITISGPILYLYENNVADKKTLVVRVEKPGDFSIYKLYLVKNSSQEPPEKFDPLLCSIDFSFKVNCPSDFDCRKTHTCPPNIKREPEINYLAKDYAGFRQLMLDRISLLVPQWKESHCADLGIAFVELMAYMGDYLSYQQDAVATEAYLGTARRRISVRRHARLVDYFMHDGCNARVWVQVRVSEDIPGIKTKPPALAKGTKLLTSVQGLPKRISRDTNISGQDFQVFETMQDVENLHEKHNEMEFYTWGAKQCCLPKGAIKATLLGWLPMLKKGNVLIFKEVLGPKTGIEADADPKCRHAVRLIKDAKLLTDKIGWKFFKPSAGEVAQKEVEVTEIEWGQEDALPFSICISSIKEDNKVQVHIERVSIVLGNIVLADHGQTIVSSGADAVSTNDISKAMSNQMARFGFQAEDLEYLGFVPDIELFRVLEETGDRCADRQKMPVQPRFNPILKKRPLTQVALSDKVDPITGDRLAVDPDGSASSAIHSEMKFVQPSVQIFDYDGNLWKPDRDLIFSGPSSMNFVVEVDDDGYANIRFGDGIYGARPKEGTKLYAAYRVGNGLAGNIGSEALQHIVSDDDRIIGVCNPLPARGGRESESIDEVRRNAPVAFRTQERAVTTEDYEEVLGRNSEVQKAAATFRWTGSWHTVFLTVDRSGGYDVDDNFKREMLRHVERYRMAGYDLEVDGPRFVSLELGMNVCVLPEYFRSDVLSTLLQVFSNRILPDGRLGLFHPDNFTFGQTVYLSQIYAVAQSVAGVAWVEITKFQRKDSPGNWALADCKLEMGRLEIARLENDPNHPENGVLIITLVGGK
jgi:hypothetical protein